MDSLDDTDNAGRTSPKAPSCPSKHNGTKQKTPQNSSTTVFLSLGANLGNPVQQVYLATERLAVHPQIKNLTISPLYATAPVETDIPQPDFINAACRLETTLGCSELLEWVESVEKELGKTPKPKTYPRPIDIDVLFFGDTVLDTEKWRIPHPRWRERLFVLVPLRHLASHLLDPSTGTRVCLETLIERMNQESVVRFS